MGPGPAGTGEPHAAQGTGDRPDVLSLPRPDEDRPDAAAVRHHDVCVQREPWRGRERDLERVIVLYEISAAKHKLHRELVSHFNYSLSLRKAICTSSTKHIIKRT